MNKIYTFLFVACFTFVFSQATAQEIWTGPKITFTKAGSADWTLEDNQDRITDSVWITRANNKGVFNIRKESEFEGNGAEPSNYGPSPVGTEWAFGTTADGVENLDFTTWIVATTVNDPFNEANPPLLVGEDMVLHLLVEDIYIDIKFLSWAAGGNGGGGFSYERSTNNTSNLTDLNLREANSLTLFPNPTNGYLFIRDLEEPQSVEIFNLQGQRMYQRVINASDQIDISSLPTGTYLFRAENGKTATFIKE